MYTVLKQQTRLVIDLINTKHRELTNGLIITRQRFIAYNVIMDFKMPGIFQARLSFKVVQNRSSHSPVYRSI